MSITPQSTLIDVAFAVCTALDRIGATAVLTGGSAATYYCPEFYQSLDADFVFRTVPERRSVDQAMAGIGFRRTANDLYEHELVAYTVEFPRGPMAIGRDFINTWVTVRRGDELLYVTSVTDCVRDRFMHFWAWNDRSALETALRVARAHPDDFDLGAFREWTDREMSCDRSYEPAKVEELLRRLG